MSSNKAISSGISRVSGVRLSSSRGLFAAAALLFVVASSTQCFAKADNAKFVNPFIGTAEQGHTFPGASAPLGLVQVSPDTGNVGWQYCSGYHYEDSEILGFSHTHLSGTGWMDLGDILLLPFTGEPRQAKYRSKFSHKNEAAKPGYYSVRLDDYGVNAELTATPRCAFHQYTFANASSMNVLVDLQHGIVPDANSLNSHVIKSQFNLEDPNTATGFMVTRGWGGERHVYFVMRFKDPVTSTTWLTPTNADRNQRLVLTFAAATKPVVQVKIGISTVDIDGARANLTREISGWDFNAVKKATYAQWNSYLAPVQVDTTPKEKEIFYTALYHTLVVPNNIADADGRYRGADNKVYTSSCKAYYSTFSLWDTYRAANPLYTVLWPDRASEIVQTMVDHFDVQGYLPMWTLWGHENFCMIGNHAIPVIVDAYQKGIRGYDVEKAYRAITTSSTVNHEKSAWDKYERYGYLPSDQIKEEAVSRTLECAFDDWCVAQMAEALGKTNDYARFSKRSGFYKNLFDTETRLMRGRKADGSWVSPFDPLKISHAGDAGGDYTEGNAWQYTWQVQQNPADLIRLLGGEQQFVTQLDKLFRLESRVYGDGATVDITGLIGQYVHGNEPCHHVAYLYCYAGQPWKTQEKISQIVKTLYDNTPGGLCGNDDCGQMSAWYVFSALGFYPVNPASGVYVLGTPSVANASIRLQNGKTFAVKTIKTTPGDIYIDKLELNGKPYPCSYITHKDLLKGGVLKVFMTSKPNPEFGKLETSRPN